jgi:DNA (cytosine-5)-methyltransferase 1
LTLRECARLQTFPDEFLFCGTPSEQGQLIGNAVPPRLATAVGCALFRDLSRGVEIGGKPGALLSFVPTLSEGSSPVLRKVTEQVNEKFIADPVPEQELLWR